PLMDEWSEFERFDEMLEFIVGHFVELVDHRIANGLYRAYVEHEDNLPAIRGRIVVEEDIRRNLIDRHLSYCRYADLTWDIPENQVIRQTVNSLAVGPFSQQLRLRLWQLDRQLQEVSPSTHSLSVFSRFTYHRLNAEYDAIHKLCWLF